MRHTPHPTETDCRPRSAGLGPAVLVVWAACLACLPSPAAGAETAAEQGAFFERRVRPLLVARCHACHSADTKPAGGLRVDDHLGLLTGGNTGPAVIPHDAAGSLLLRRVQEEGKRRMPLDSEPLTAEEVAILETWIAAGAVWPRLTLPEESEDQSAWYDSLRAEHWAWQPLVVVPPPSPADAGWALDDADRFIRARLEQEGLEPAGDASRRDFIRRVTFDLTGLPPEPADVAAFLADESATAHESLVDRLLASADFGIQWGRHWLDVARYGESTGPSRNVPYPHAWRYRDYVIDAVARDVPFDQFIREQVAGDLLPAESEDEANRLRTATGFLALGPKDVNQRFKNRFVMDNVDEQIDVVTRSVLGLTVSCARCHDHKFDPVPTTDYYALAGIFTSTELAAGLRNQMGGSGLAYYVPGQLVRLEGDVPEPDAAEVERLTHEAQAAKERWEQIQGTPEGLARGPDGRPVQRKFRLADERAQAALLELTDPARHGLVVHGVRESATIGDTSVRIRGIAENLGPTVTRGFLTAFTVPGSGTVPTDRSGRLELAAWLTATHNPLTPRVIINRIWARLFGTGIVSTVDNFGTTGDRPSHPELLDFLARRFVADGWSVKTAIRRLVLSRTYRLGTAASAAELRQDPANRLQWRHAPRRLSAEEIRDAMLEVAGTLQASAGPGSFIQEWQMREIRDNGAEAKRIHEHALAVRQRSVYLPLLRGLVPRSLEAFDPVEQALVTGTRDTTNVPGQALYLLNSTFVRGQSLALAERLLAADDDDAVRIRTAFSGVLGRAATPTELDRALAFLHGFAADYAAEQPALSATPQPAATVAAVDPNIVDPDQADQTGIPVVEGEVVVPDARTAAWLALVQALLASAEFRLVP
jgi:cytochrome c553